MILIRIDQNGQGFVFRLDPGSDSLAIEGLALVNTSGNTIDIRSGQNVIAGNFIGVDTDGVTFSGTGTAVAISPSISGNLIGGITVDQRNVIAASGSDVVATLGNNETIVNNYINTTAAGTAPLGNATNAISVGAGGATIGNGGMGNVIGQWNGNGSTSGSRTSTSP